jgi:CBS domain-containing protein
MNFNRKLISTAMTRIVCRASPEHSAMSALQMMQSKSVSSVLVIEDELILGIITERDIVRAMHGNGTLESLTCVDLMQSPVVSVTGKTRCLEAYHLMVSRGIRHLGVTDEAGHVIGIASEGDLMRNFGNEYYMTFKDVGGVMSQQFCKLPAAATVATALGQMLENHQSCVVVTDAQGCPVGMLTERDVVRLCNQHVDPHRLTLREAMHAPVKTVKPGERLHEAVKAMEQTHIRRLVVVGEDGVACGLLTHHEIARGLEGDYVTFLREIVELQARDLQHAAQAIDEKLLLANILRSVTGTAVLASDLEYRISYATPAVAEVLGMRLSDLGGTDIRETLKKAGWLTVEAAFDEAAVVQRARHYLVSTGRGTIDLQLSVLLDSQERAQGYLVLGQRA